MGIAFGGTCLTVPQQGPDHLKAHSALYGIAGEGMPEIVDSDALNPRLLSDGVPGLFEVHEVGALLVSGDDIRVVEHLGQGRQHFDCGLVQEDRLCACFGVLEAEDTAL